MFFFLLSIFILSVLLTWLLRVYAISRKIIDVPNSRSSHSIPTPRGGGVAIVISFIFSLLTISLFEYVPASLVVSLVGSGLLVAAIGFLDDLGHIAARWRLLGHFLSAFWILYWLNGFSSIVLFGSEVQLGWSGVVLASIYLVWMLNLYNFMDGIDGIASIESICVCLGGAIIFLISKESFSGFAVVVMALSFSVMGFLVWNFPPARIFMGDAGSGFLGISIGALSLWSSSIELHWLWSWLILSGVFIVDSTVTLLRRLLRGEKIYEAHRSHAYQFASRWHGGHLPVTLAVLGINVLWLLPFAVCVGVGLLDGAVGLVLAYMPLLVLAIWYKAGAKHQPF
ncbi:MraY family glycosyltransferase [Pseudomonas sp. TUM22785]|uniref:MraY family glycosyltransferase n=1 Tax=Pseudomonas sp. TUM22785 TaxID=3019098 RepID=UPI002306920B|nr:glycosyltransferase family 4 protein [Pseudomonas sp. TUM22785]WCD82156.1 glycosyltransferase family 4 protein [Pseudomonas sp. TUM22785]